MDATLVEKPGQRPPLKNESENGLRNEAGTLAMARTREPDSATSQFFINVKDNAFLDREQAADGVGYAVFGKVVEGMDVVKKIEAVKTTTKGMHQDVPIEPVVIESVEIIDGAVPAAEAAAPAAPAPDKD
jgi:peptidyl-prolyl cis-trans isomerase A (cyclophilin A)